MSASAAAAADQAALEEVARVEALRLSPELLTEAAAHPDPEVRARAARALGRLRSQEAAGLLSILVLDDEDAVRQEAAFALGLTPGSPPLMRRALEAESKEGVRAELVEALGRQGEAADLEIITAALLTGTGREQRAALLALGELALRGELSPREPGLMDLLSSRVMDRDTGSRLLAAHTLVRLDLPVGWADPRWSARLADAVRREHHRYTRPWLIRAAGSALPAEAWAELAGWLAEAGTPEDRVALARATASRGEPAPEGTLPALLADPDRSVRVAALEATHHLPWAEELAAPLSRCMAVGDDEIRSLALVPLLGAGLAGEPKDWLGPELHPWLRAASLHALDDPHRLQALATSDPAPEVRSAAALALSRMDGAESLLEGLLGSHDEVVDGIASSALRQAPAEPPAGDLGEHVHGPPSDVVSARVDTTRGEFIMLLDPDTAPVAVSHFVARAEDGFYQGLSFHRVVPGFVVQGGDPRGDGWGAPPPALPDEPSSEPFGPFSVGVATWGPDTGGSQWFVTLSHQPHLEGRHTRMGEVVKGEDVLLRLRKGDVIRGITVETLTGR